MYQASFEPGFEELPVQNVLYIAPAQIKNLQGV